MIFCIYAKMLTKNESVAFSRPSVQMSFSTNSKTFWTKFELVVPCIPGTSSFQFHSKLPPPPLRPLPRYEYRYKFLKQNLQTINAHRQTHGHRQSLMGSTPIFAFLFFTYHFLNVKMLCFLLLINLFFKRMNTSLLVCVAIYYDL